MKSLAAALLLGLGNQEISVDNVKKVLAAGGAKENEVEIKKIVDAMKGKKCDDLVKEGLKKLGNMSVGGGEHEEKHDKKGKKEEKKKEEEKKEEEEEEDMGFGGLF